MDWYSYSSYCFSAYFVKRIRDILTTITVCALAITGHYGGNLTHGEDHLFPKKGPEHVHGFQATLLHLRGINHELLNFKFQGKRYRLTDVHRQVVKGILA